MESSEVYLNIRSFFMLFVQACKEGTNLDLIALCADLLNSRLQDLQMIVHHRLQFFICLFEALSLFSLNSGSQYVAIYSRIEQIIIKQFMIIPPLDLIFISCSLFSNRGTMRLKFFFFKLI